MKLADKKLFFSHHLQAISLQKKKSLSELLLIELIFYVAFYPKYYFFWQDKFGSNQKNNLPLKGKHVFTNH